MEVGSAAVELMTKGILGVTVVSYRGGRIEYMPVAEAIVQRLVDPADVALFESLGISFGRKPQTATVEAQKISGKPVRVY